MIEMDDIDIIVPSKGRPETKDIIFSLFPMARYCIAESEVDAYGITDKNRLLVHKDDLVGLIPKRQWILDNCKKRIVVQCDDYIQKVFCLTGFRPRHITDPDAIFRILHNAAIVTDGLGLKMFGFTTHPKPMYAPDNHPFAFCGMIAGVFGIVNDGTLKYDQNLTTREDVDMTLQGLLKCRVNWQDTRFCFFGKDWNNQGGLQSVRTAESEERDVAYMKQKWGAHVHWQSGGKVGSKRNHVSIRVTRASAGIKI